MSLEVFAYHSVETSLLCGLPVLDVGCRDFDFARALAQRGHRVIALDPDPEVVDPKIHNVDFRRMALATSTRIWDFAVTDNPEGRYIVDDGPPGPKAPSVISVPGVSVSGLMLSLSIDLWDVVKLNCEGGEGPILSNWPGPVARQIVVSFHEHYRPIGLPAIQNLVDHLSQWYRPIRHELDARYGGGLNFWDSVFCLREL